MQQIQIKGLEELKRQLTEFSDRRMAAATATAMSRTAVKLRDELKAGLGRSIDRPTPYTLGAIYAKTTTADKLDARVGFKDASAATRGGTPAANYVLPQVMGGARRLKRFERALAAVGALPDDYMVVAGDGAQIDAYGNVTRQQIAQILLQLRQTPPGAERKSVKDQKRAGGRFFVVPPGGSTQPGIYQRELIGRNVTPVLLFVKPANYSQRYDFYGEARRRADEILPAEMQRAVEEHLRRMAAQGRR